MRIGKLLRPIDHLLCAAVAGIFMCTISSTVLAQVKPAPAKQPSSAKDAKPGNQTPPKAPATSTPQSSAVAQKKPVIKKPPVRKVRPKKRGVAIPKPTVVLKPGEVPAIQFDIKTYNFGRIRSGTPIRHDFWFTNTGTGPLEILRVRPS